MDATGLVDLQRYLAGVTDKLENHRPLLDRWGPKTVEWQQQNLERGISPDGEPFAALAEGYVRQRTGRALSPKRRTIGRTNHPFGARPLIDTTAMFATMIWLIPGPSEVRGGATARSPEGAPYPLFHQEGRGVRKRPWSGFRRENLAELAKDVHAFALEATRK